MRNVQNKSILFYNGTDPNTISREHDHAISLLLYPKLFDGSDANIFNKQDWPQDLMLSILHLVSDPKYWC